MLAILSTQPPQVVERSRPVAADAQAIVRVRLAGISARDLRHVPATAVIGGQEMVGVVVEGHSDWKDKRVTCDPTVVCRRCDMCMSGLSSHCRRRAVLGTDCDGCFAEFVAVPERNLHALPDSISDTEGVFAVLVAAAAQATSQCLIEPRQTATVVGCGRLGLVTAQLLRERGCKLTIVGRHEAKLQAAERLGLAAISADDLLWRGDRDVVVDCSGTAEGFALASALVRPRGVLVLKSERVAGCDLSRVTAGEVRVIGSRDGSLGEALALLARRAVDVSSLVTRTMRLSEGVEAFALACRGESIKVLLRAG